MASARIITIAALLVTLAVTGVRADEINPILGKVGDFSISEIDLERIIAGQTAEMQQQLSLKPELKAGLVEELLLKKAIARQAKKEGYDRKPEFREKLSYLVDDFLARDYLTRVVLAGIAVPDDELQKYYKEHAKDFQLPETYRLRHIFINASGAAAEDDKKKAYAKAEALLLRLNKGDDFAKVAAEASEDSNTAAKGGDLGVITSGKTNSAEFEKAAFALKSGETSGIITTPFGYHIIRCEEKNEARTASFAETKEFIAATLKKELEQQKIQEFMEKVAKESGLEVYTDRISGTAREAGGKDLIK